MKEQTGKTSPTLAQCYLCSLPPSPSSSDPEYITEDRREAGIRATRNRDIGVVRIGFDKRMMEKKEEKNPSAMMRRQWVLVEVTEACGRLRTGRVG